MNAAFASDMLLHKPESDIRYIDRMQVYERHLAEKEAAAQPKAKRVDIQSTAADTNSDDVIFTSVLKGDKKHIVAQVEEALKGGAAPGDIINGSLIPAINDVGEFISCRS